MDVNLPIALTEAEIRSRESASGMSPHGKHEINCLNGSGALIEAARNGHPDIVRELFKFGAFDFGNRALKELTNDGGSRESKDVRIEMVGLFLAHLGFSDHEFSTYNSRKKREIGEVWHSISFY